MNTKLRNVTLEVSLKPFAGKDECVIRKVASSMFQQWKRLCDQAEVVSVMLWSSDGSEILEFSGDLETTFEWACWVGRANPHGATSGDSEGIGTHSGCRPYCDAPPPLTYSWLKRLVMILRETGEEILGKPLRIGTTFDPGPEFAVSSFKYERHPEICTSGTMGVGSFICCYARLHADKKHYAAFPEGIPEGTTIGAFLGAQTNLFADGLGFDYLWLSNGFGFGAETWGLKGAVFNGKGFDCTGIEAVREQILDFWRDFRANCPTLPLETRGTNLSTGMDIASDAVPMRDIYSGGFGIEPPPNSPWAALNGDFGLELVGWMSHIAEIPASTYPFRFYMHDPWWNNSPWIDRYGRQPHDIYIPLSMARLDGEGQVTQPTAVEILTVDDSYGRLSADMAADVQMHLAYGLSTGPDSTGPLVWIYPFDEVHDVMPVETVFFGDWFMRGAVNHGLPLNTVISTANWTKLAQSNSQALQGSVLISPVPTKGSAWSETLRQTVEAGGQVLLYGPLRDADPQWLAMLDIECVEPITGKMELALHMTSDTVGHSMPTKQLMHSELLSAGGIEEIQANVAPHGATTLAEVLQGEAKRLVATTRSLSSWQGGRVAWVRGTVACDPDKMEEHLLVPYPHTVSFPAEAMMRLVLSVFGYELRYTRPAGALLPMFEDSQGEKHAPLTCISRHNNGFVFSGYVPDTTVSQQIHLPQGAPVMLEQETCLEAGCASYHFPRGWRNECRVFVEQTTGIVGCRTAPPSTEFDICKRLHVVGLCEATVRFFPEPGSEENVRILHEPHWPYIEGHFLNPARKNDALGHYFEVENVTGELLISW